MLVQRIALLTIICLTPIVAHAQLFGVTSDGPRSLAMSRSDLADPRDEWEPNPALPTDTSSNLHAVLSPQPTGIAQSFSAGFGGGIALDSNWLAGAAFSTFQWGDAFSWESFSLQASRTFTIRNSNDTIIRRAVAGVRLRYSQQTPGAMYLPIDDIALDLGASFDLFPQLTFAAVATHLVTLYNNQSVPIESPTAWIGLSYRPTMDLTFDGTFESSSEEHPVFHFGAEYGIDHYLFVRAGADTQPGELSGGIGLLYNNFRADFAVTRHPDLGPSVSFGIGFQL